MNRPLLEGRSAKNTRDNTQSDEWISIAAHVCEQAIFVLELRLNSQPTKKGTCSIPQVPHQMSSRECHPIRRPSPRNL